MCTYSYFKLQNAYAIVAKTENEKKVIRYFSCNRKQAKELTRLFNDKKLDIIHFEEVVHDYILDHIV